ncbi:MAG: rod-binding protein [Planctomycetaceae bacterium]|nr:rod-binding protein [Planctomycetaceae bacterium]
MNIPTNSQVSSVLSGFPSQDASRSMSSAAALEGVEEPSELREAFDNFVGQTFFQQMLSAMRKTVDKPAYFHGGRTEEVFQGQLDQVLSEHLTKAAADEFTDPLFELYSLRRA